jgi:ribosomal-protein-serine acetyltransferase
MDKKHLPVLVETERLLLKRHEIDTAPAMFQSVEHDRLRLSRFLPWVKHTRTIQDERNYIQMTLAKWETHELFDYGIFRKSDQAYLGNAGLHTISWANSRCELGYWILGSAEGHGYMSEAVAGLARVCFEIGFNRLEIHCDPENSRSANIPIRLGFRREGRLAEHTVDQDGNPRDSLIFAILKSDRRITGSDLSFTKPDGLLHLRRSKEEN